MRIGILCSIKEEIKHFNFKINSSTKLGGRFFLKSRSLFHEIILVECGIGKVNAAIVSSILIQQFDCNLLIFSGIAGGIDPEIRIGDVIVGDSIIQYDYGAIENKTIKVFRAGDIPIGSKKKFFDFKIDPEIRNLIKQKLPNLKMGKIITGDTFINCNQTRNYLFEKFGAQVVDMEGGAVVQVSEQFEIPAIIVRCVSDLAGKEKQKNSSIKSNQAGKNSSKTVEEILNVLNLAN